MSDPVSNASLQRLSGTKKKRLLVVDDDEFVCKLLVKVISKYMGLEVDMVRSGGEAIAAALTGRYDGAIIALVLPHTSGVKAIRTIMTMCPGFPIIATAAVSSDSCVKNAKRYGIGNILWKPFKMSALVEKISELLGSEDESISNNK